MSPRGNDLSPDVVIANNILHVSQDPLDSKAAACVSSWRLQKVLI